jgi:ABC-type transport system involved in multi-copper enzyme maturation permease subunit
VSSAKHGPFRTIVEKEIAANLLSYKFFIVILLASVLIFTSLFVMARDFKARTADYQLIKPQPGEPSAVLPLNPLSVFAKGLEDSITRSYELNFNGIETRTGRSSVNSVFDFFPAPDFVYIIKVVLSLVALLFGFDLISREKEAGTLKLTLANPVSRAALLAGKWVGNLLSLAVPFLLVTGIGIALLSLDPAFRLTASGLGRLALILVLSLTYMALFLSLGLFISTVTKRSSSSLVILLLIWAAMVFILPNLGTLLARQIVELPSVRALQEKRDQIWTREVLLSYADRSTWDARLAAMNDEIDRLEEDYRQKFGRLVRLAKSFNRVSPAASFVYAVTEIAGTGIGEESRLKGEVIRYKNRVLSSGTLEGKRAPAFIYAYRSVGNVLAEGGMFDIAWLLVFNIIIFAAGYAAVIRYDVR